MRLFNDAGAANVSTRQIAAEIGISHGNLTYHFPGKKDILLAIYNTMYDGLQNDQENLLFRKDELLAPEPPTNPAELNAMFLFILEFQKRYRFLFAEMLEVTRLVPEIRDGFTERYQDRIETFRSVFIKLRENGFMQNKTADDTVLALARTIVFINTLWLSQSQVYSDPGLVSAEATLDMLWNAIRPHLNSRGIEHIQKL